MKITIVDDHPLVVSGLKATLSIDEEFELVGEASTVQEALKLITTVQPDISIIDLRLGSESGLEVVKRCKEDMQGSKFIILTSSLDRGDFTRAVHVGIDGYALKEALPEELLYAVRLVARGRKYYDPIFLEPDRSEQAGAVPYEQLTPKETEVLRALGMGLSNRDIARRLFITEYTVKKHVSQILAKLQLVDRTQAALWANAKGIATYQ